VDEVEPAPALICVRLLLSLELSISLNGRFDLLLPRSSLTALLNVVQLSNAEEAAIPIPVVIAS
jgi:hypothetical protein